MTILFDSRRKIKPSNPRFASAILGPRNRKVRPYSDADARWWAEELAAKEDRRIDERYREWAQTDAVCRGVSMCSLAYETEHENGELAEMFGARLPEMIGC